MLTSCAVPCRSVFVSGILFFRCCCFYFVWNLYFTMFSSHKGTKAKTDRQTESERERERELATAITETWWTIEIEKAEKHTRLTPYISKKRILFITCIILSASILTACESHIYGCSSSQRYFCSPQFFASIAKLCFVCSFFLSFFCWKVEFLLLLFSFYFCS